MKKNIKNILIHQNVNINFADFQSGECVTKCGTKYVSEKEDSKGIGTKSA